MFIFLQPLAITAKEPYILGLTGGIASGKSSVCKRLAGLGAAVIDCDKLGENYTLTWTIQLNVHLQDNVVEGI